MAEPLQAADLQGAIERLGGELRALQERFPIVLLGIANGGVTLARLLAESLGRDTPWGTLNALFHRDDIGLKPVSSDFQPTQFDFDIDGAHVVLVDDVFASGRTVRAALNELFDHGRPASVHLAVLVETARARLPIRPDHVGLHYPCGADETVEITIHPTDPHAHTAELRRLS